MVVVGKEFRIWRKKVENRLKKIAKELYSFDEASLLQLWEKYHDIVKRFEPTRKWEESVLILGMIQTVHWKNQLFNLKWADSKKGLSHPYGPIPGRKEDQAKSAGPVVDKKKKSPAKVIALTNQKKNSDKKKS